MNICRRSSFASHHVACPSPLSLAACGSKTAAAAAPEVSQAATSKRQAFATFRQAKAALLLAGILAINIHHPSDPTPPDIARYACGTASVHSAVCKDNPRSTSRRRPACEHLRAVAKR